MARTFAQKLATTTREAQALDLRSQGQTYEEIAQKLAFSNRGAAYKAVQRALLATVRQPAEDVRALELERLGDMFRTVWPKATDSAHPQHLRAIDSMLSIMNRMDRLNGLDTRGTSPKRGRTGRSQNLRDRSDAVLIIDVT